MAELEDSSACKHSWYEQKLLNSLRVMSTVRKYPDILQHLSEAHIQNPMASEDPKGRSVGASGTGTSGQADTAQEVGLDRTHPQ